MDTHVCVVGLGYIGFPTSIMFTTNGVKVTGVDNNPKVIEMLGSGKLHIHETGLVEGFQMALDSGQFNLSSEMVEADVFIIAVPTPFNPDKTADLSAVTSATKAIVPVLQKGNMVILESTSPPRTTIDIVKPLLEQSGLTCGVDFDLVYSPERVLPGKIFEELVNNDRIVGGYTREGGERAKRLYAHFVKGEIFVTDPTTAEMVKLMENTYRDVNIALANEFSRIAHEQQINVWEAIRLANRHPRVSILTPGPGVGGHCISVDPWFIVEASPSVSQLIKTARLVNDGQPEFLFELLEKQVGSIKGKKMAALGLSYKPNIDDLRESPAIDFAELLASRGAEVSVYEPYVQTPKMSDGITVTTSLKDAIQGVEVIVFLVGHDEFKALDLAQLAQLYGDSSGKEIVIVDSVNIFVDEDDSDSIFKLVTLGDGLQKS